MLEIWGEISKYVFVITLSFVAGAAFGRKRTKKTTPSASHNTCNHAICALAISYCKYANVSPIGVMCFYIKDCPHKQ